MEDGQVATAETTANDASSSFLVALEELRNLRPQLMTAAEYCEQQYLNSDEKDVITANLREYASKALVNVVDHLGTVAYKLNLCIDQETSRIATSDTQLMTLQQRYLSMRTYTEQDAAKQQQQPKAGPRTVKQYRIPDATAEAAFAAAQSFVEMPRETFDELDEQTESVYASPPAVPARRPGLVRRLSESWETARRPSFSSASQQLGAPGSPSRSLFTATDLTMSSSRSLTLSNPGQQYLSGQLSRQLSSALSDANSDASASSTRLLRSASKLRRMFSSGKKKDTD